MLMLHFFHKRLDEEIIVHDNNENLNNINDDENYKFFNNNNNESISNAVIKYIKSGCKNFDKEIILNYPGEYSHVLDDSKLHI